MNPPIIPTEDFWSRQANAQAYSFTFTPLGVRAEITANTESGLSAARWAAARYCQTEPCGDTTIGIQIIVRQIATAPLPKDWPERITYSGVGPWITLTIGEWGYGFGNLEQRTAVVILSPVLAAESQSVSRYFIDHYLLNFLFTDWAMLHASGVVTPNGQSLLLMVGAHNRGKSTTALRLLRAGYLFLADGMALLQARAGHLQVSGYPLGEVKLRDDVLAQFPEYAGEPIHVREQRKTVVNLRDSALHSQHLVKTLISPPTIHLLFTERGADTATTLAPCAPETARHGLAAHTIFWDEATRLERNAAILNRLLASAHMHHLLLGSDPVGLISTIAKLT